ncbi:hypothetical protein ES703_122117 [subsurface metagenome]
MAYDSRLVNGRKISNIVAASLYFACRVHGVTRTLNDIASTNALKSEAENVHKYEMVIARDYRMMCKSLSLKPPKVSPLSLVAKICSQLELPSNVEEYASELLQEYTAKKFSAGKDPKGLAASAIYIACQRLGVKVTQIEVGKVAQITDVTIRNRYKEMIKDLNIVDLPLKRRERHINNRQPQKPKILKLQ